MCLLRHIIICASFFTINAIGATLPAWQHGSMAAWLSRYPSYQYWQRSIEFYLGKSLSHVDVTSLNRGSTNKEFVKALQPRIWIMQNWSSDHPGHEVLKRMRSTSLYPSPRELFSSNNIPSTKNYIGPTMNKAFHQAHDHITIRVYPPGNDYEIFVLDDRRTDYPVIKQFGPYRSGA